MDENQVQESSLQISEGENFDDFLSRAFDEAAGTAPDSAPDDSELLNPEVAEDTTEGTADEIAPIDPEVVEDPKVEEQVQIPQETQEYIAQLEGEKQISDTFRSIVEPHFEFLESIGENPFQHAQNLFQLSHALHTADDAGKASILADLFVSFGVSADAIETALNERLTRPAPDPVLQKLDRLEQQLAQQKQPAPPQAPQAPTPEMVKQVQEFSAKHEFFESVKHEMGFLLQSGRASNLKEAYTIACRMNDEVQATLRERGKTAAQANRQSVKTKTSPSSAAKNGGSLEQLLSDLYDDMA